MDGVNRRWYDRIVEALLAVQSDVVFVIDPLRLTGLEELKTQISTRYPSVFDYSSQMQLRRLLKTETSQIIIRFKDEVEIPYDLLSKYSVLPVGSDSVFPLLDQSAISELAHDQLQPIYEYYIENTENRVYERLSRPETLKIINEVVGSPDRLRTSRMHQLENQIVGLLSKSISDINDWTSLSGGIASLWGELRFLNDCSDVEYPLEALRHRINLKFTEDVVRYYDDTAYSTKLPMQWNILGIIESAKASRNAILCFDCLGFEEWNAVKEFLHEQEVFSFTERFSFAVLPTETNHSRTTLFAGLSPKNQIGKLVDKVETRHEERLFKMAMQVYGVEGSDTYYQRCTGPDEILPEFSSLHDYRRIGLAFTFIDTLTHNSMMDKKKLIRDIKDYLGKSKMASLINELAAQGFDIYICSDHGSVSVKGNDIRPKKDLVDEKARRYLIFDRKELASEYLNDDSILLQLKNVLGEQWVVLLRDGVMFGSVNDECLTHGGISMDEIVIPFVKVVRQ